MGGALGVPVALSVFYLSTLMFSGVASVRSSSLIPLTCYWDPSWFLSAADGSAMQLLASQAELLVA